MEMLKPMWRDFTKVQHGVNRGVPTGGSFLGHYGQDFDHDTPNPEEEPWWYRRCTHPQHPLAAWRVQQEAEQVAVIYSIVGDRVSPFHLVVAYKEWTSCCLVDRAFFMEMDQRQLMAHIDNEINFLRLQYE